MKKKLKNKSIAKKPKRFNIITILLIILLAVRLIMQVLYAVASLANLLAFSIFSVFALLYLISIIGILIKQKWGSILVMVIAIIDLIAALLTGGANGVGAGIADLVILFLAYREYKQIPA